MSVLIRIVVLISVSVLMSCQAQYSQYIAQDIEKNSLYLDEHFPEYQSFDIETMDEVFAIDDDMADLVKRTLRTNKNLDDRADDLLKLIFTHNARELIYDSGANTVATETFKSRKANCMSLTILAYVLATEADFLVEFQKVKVPEFWIQDGKYSLLTGHVNLLVSGEDYRKKLLITQAEYEMDFMPDYVDIELDFDPNAVRNSFKRSIISKDTMLAMFYNNKGAKLLVNNQLEHAYAYFKAATKVAPDFDVSWSNLGILYRMIGNEKASYNAYSKAISENGENLSALTNLSILFKKQNKNESARQLEQILYAKRRENPYYHLMLADSALVRNEFEEAIEHYEHTLTLDHDLHNAYLGLAKAYYQTKDYQRSETMIRRAIRYNDDKQTDRLYAAKLRFLKSLSE